jgi:hypothetical protein
MNEFVVFYAWQSDRLERLNRHLIRIALNLAALNISSDVQVGTRVRIDADTEGVLGHVPVTDTILKKIMNCDAFVPDLTFIAETTAEKFVCNPNVMLEYGYALHAKSHSVMMPVMNTAYGPAEKLPFDMGHLRHPIKYDLPASAKNAERRVVRKALTEEFEAILRLMVAARVKPTKATPFPEASSVQHSPAFLFTRGEVVAEFGNPGEQEYRFEGGSAIYLRLFPKFSDQPRIGRARLKSTMQNQIVRPMSAKAFGGIAASNEYGWIVIEPLNSNTTQAFSQGFATGEIWGVNSHVFRPITLEHFGRPEEKSVSFGAIGVEKVYTRTLENYVSTALTEMKLTLPYVVEIGAVGLQGVYMGVPHPEFSNGHYAGPIRDEKLVRRYELQEASDNEIHEVLREFFDELYDLTECSRSDILTDEHIRLNGLPERS